MMVICSAVYSNKLLSQFMVLLFTGCCRLWDQGDKHFVLPEGDRLAVRCGQYGDHDSDGHTCAEQTVRRGGVCPLSALCGATLTAQR